MKRTLPRILFSIMVMVAVSWLVACRSESVPASPQPTMASQTKLSGSDTSVPTTAPTSTAPSTPEIVPEAVATATPEPGIAITPTAGPDSGPSHLDSLPDMFPGTPQASGEVIIVYGYVLDTSGGAIADAAVEFWQTDSNGIYQHPGDPGTDRRDLDFQFFGTSVSDETGMYAFRTILPGYYEPRPKHIHLKVKIDGREALISQFYFDTDRKDLAGEGLFRQAGELGELLILKPVANVEVDGQMVQILNNDIVIGSNDSPGSLTLTPAQGEGPYYPIVDVSRFDNDLTITP